MLAPDVAIVKSSVPALISVESALSAYVSSVYAIPLTPQPLSGTESNYDPLQNNAALKAAIQTAQSHCDYYEENVMTPLYNWKGTTTALGPEMILPGLATLLTTIDQIGGGQPTAAQQDTIKTNLQTVASAIAFVCGPLNGFHDSMVTALTQIDSDHSTFTNGAMALSTQYTQTEQQIEADAEQYIAYQGIMNTILQIGRGILDAIQSLQTAVQQASVNSSEAETAASELSTQIATLTSKVAAVNSAIQSAAGDDFGSAMQELDVQDAQSAWTQLIAYLKTCNFQSSTR